MQSASSAVPLLSPVIAPMAQNFGPLLKQLTASPALRLGVCKSLQQFALITDVIYMSICHYISKKDFISGCFIGKKKLIVVDCYELG